ncbi:MAG: hypothetical protein IJA75_02025 [Oscillospiraceae bacterium]|nr:hypothetical protein [Oscillospiraceae bacterium]
MKNVLKLLAALAAIAGVVYAIATYGDKIVEFAKKIWNALPKCPNCEETEVVEEPAAEEEAPAAEEAPAVEEEPVAEEVVVEESEPVAEETDFAE